MGKNTFYIDENFILNTIQKVLNENRKVIKLGNKSNKMPSDNMPMQNQMPNEQPMMQQGQMQPDTMPMQNDPMMQQDDMMQNGNEDENQFDTNFDAGVDADEDSDPKHYIQQLTGKLSQSLNSYNNEQDDDSGLNKYVANMIVSAACKNLDDKAKKEIIEKIKSANFDDNFDNDDTDDNVENDDFDDNIENDDFDSNENNANVAQNDNMPINEKMYTKKKISEMFNNIANNDEHPSSKIKNKPPYAWSSKF